jgi:hypothetical protein
MNRRDCCACVIGLAPWRSNCIASKSTGLWAMCFRSIGPVDKPMPSFCVIKIGKEKISQKILLDGDVPPIQLHSSDWRALTTLILTRTSKSSSDRLIFGKYEIRLSPPADVVFAAPEIMRMVATCLSSFEGLTEAQVHMIQRLKLRIEPSS